MRYLLLILLFPLTLSGQGLIVDSYRFGDVLTSLFINQKSIDFDGINEHMGITDADGLSFTNDSINMSAWIRMADATGFAIMSKSDEYLFWVNANDKLEAKFIDSSTGGFIGRTYNTAITSRENEWIHVSTSFDGTTVKIFLNGVQVDDTDANSGAFTSMENTTSALFVGVALASNYAEGEIDQSYLASAPLGVSSLKEMMAVRDLSYLSLNGVGWWEYDDADVSGTTVSDRINSFDGTMVNSPDRIVCIPFPYSYQLNTTATAENLTPFQSATDTVFSGFSIFGDKASEYMYKSTANYRSADTAGTISFWCRPFNNSNQTYFSSNDEATGNTFFAVSTVGSIGNPQYLDFIVFDGSVQQNITSNIEVSKFQLTHCAITSNGSEYKMYLNGDSVGFSIGAGTNNGDWFADIPNRDNICVGAFRRTTVANYYGGPVDQMLVFNRALTTAEIKQLYNGHGSVDARSTSMADNIVGYWTGYGSTNTSNGVIDLSSGGNDLDPLNYENADFSYEAPREIFEADSAGSFDFPGTNEHIVISDDPSLSFTDDSIYLSAWINMDDATNFPIFSKATEYLFWVNASDKIEARFIDASTGGYLGRTYNTAITGNQDKWIFVEATFDGTNIDIRIDGVIVDDTDANSGSFTSMENTANDLYIAYDGSNYANGSISNASISGTSSTLCEGQEAYNDGSPIDLRVSTFSSNMVSLWRMNQGDNPAGVVLDIIGSNNATATNSPTLDTDSYPTN